MLFVCVSPILAQQHIINDEIFQNRNLTIDPPNPLFVSHGSNDPLLTISSGAHTVGVEGVVIGSLNGEKGRLRIEGGGYINVGGGGQQYDERIGQTYIYRGDSYLGLNDNSTGIAHVTGLNSLWSMTQNLNVGYFGTGALEISDQGQVSNKDAILGLMRDGIGTVIVSGMDSRWSNERSMIIGVNGKGTVRIEDGGLAETNSAYISEGNNGNGEVTITGQYSTWEITNTLYLARKGKATLTIADQGTVNVTMINSSSETQTTSDIFVRDSGSTLMVSQDMRLGTKGTSTLTIENGGSVNTNSTHLGWADSTGRGNVTVKGSGSELVVRQHLILGSANLHEPQSGQGTVRIENNGTVRVENTLKIWNNSQMILDGGNLHVNVFAAYDHAINFQFNSGHLRVDDTFHGDLTIPELGVFSGNNTVKGNVTNRGAVAPGTSPGLITVEGDFIQEANANILIEIDGLNRGTGYDALDIEGDLIINGGTLKILSAASYLPSLDDQFQIFNVTGTISGSFSSIEAFSPGEGLTWDYSNLYTTGSISVVVPEPATTALIVVALVGIAGVMYRKRRS